MISFNKVSFSYPSKEIFKEVSFAIDKGEFVFLIGESGTGKTTLLRMINMELVPAHGEITVSEYNSRTIKKPEVPLLRRRIGFVFQDYKLLDDRDVFDNVALPLYLAGLKPDVVKKKVFNVLNEVGVFESYKKMPEELSGGEQQRVSIARAMVNEPFILIADEPTGNLDTHSGAEIMSLLHKLHGQGTTIVMVTHDPKIAAHTQRTINLVDGLVDNVVHNGHTEKKVEYETV